jgi:uncharacterized membrane protein (UPF0127 family)
MFAYQHGEVRCLERGVLFTRVRRPVGFAARARGLLGTAAIGADAGLWFDRCSAVHMFGMRYPLDLVFIKKGEVIRLCAQVKPLQARMCTRADTTLEVCAGAIESSGLTVGDRLEFRSLQ